MNAEELKSILDKHRPWLEGKPGGERADLTKASLAGANLTGADLTKASLAWANLAGAYLTRANLAGANLAGADLTRANLAGADLTKASLAGADLTGADLTKAYLTGAKLAWANLAGAKLAGTILDPAAPVPPVTDEEITAAGLEIRGEQVWGWRTATSQHCGLTAYVPGQCYEAPWFSVDTKTDCHPGIYLAGKAWLDENYPDKPHVRCYCLRSELVHAGDKWRAKRLWVVEG